MTATEDSKGTQQQKKILVTRDFPDKGIDLLKHDRNFEVTVWPLDRPMTQSELIEQAKNHHALLCTLTDLIDRHFLDQCRHLEIISQFAVGYDNIDVAHALQLKIPIAYTPDAMSEATADIAFGLMIATARKMFFMHKTIQKGEWGYFRPKGHLGMELKQKTLGILGLGRIGMKMAQRCKGAYDMEIIYCNRKPDKRAEKALNARFVNLNELLAQSDILSVHCALTAETRGIFDYSAFERMKPDAIFINTSRGPVHNESDLIKALDDKKIWGAGLDVTDPEPMRSDNPLLSMENVCVLPHVGSATTEARNEMSVMAAVNIIEFYRKNRVPHLVTP